MNLPVICTDKVYHIGQLDIKHKGEHGSSLEANMLSVSHCPSAWRQIARLGGRSIYQFSKKNAQFLDFYKIDKELKEQIIKWGLDEGLVKQKTMWNAAYFDSDYDEWMYSSHATKKEAIAELPDWMDFDLDSVKVVDTLDELAGDYGVVKSQVYVGTSKLNNLLDSKANLKGDSFTYLTIAWVAELTELDGVWWNETYEPSRFSAPRAGICKGKEQDWTIKEIDWNSLPDDDDLIFKSSSKLVTVNTINTIDLSI